MNRRDLIALAGSAALAGCTSSGSATQDQSGRDEAVEELTQLSMAHARIAAARDSLEAVPSTIDVASDERPRRWNEDLDDLDRELEALQSDIGERAEEIMDSMGVDGA